ncbi:protein LHY [Cocos nucifera]|uniref:Protein LHY n=1 Tax=Cocos nucifera TaxID=13894 RepID=A0A8K0N4Y6_COCNU|nr:protein LHY [Cocos nucifera]
MGMVQKISKEGKGEWRKNPSFTLGKHLWRNVGRARWWLLWIQTKLSSGLRSLLEKEALAKGIPLGHSHDIEIPPPRPKRKPSFPYPRKVDVGSLSPFEESKDEKVSNSAASQEKPVATEIQQRTKWTSGSGSCSEVFNLLQDVPSASMSSANKGSSNICTFQHYVKEVKEKTAQSESSKTVKDNHEEKKEADHTDIDVGRLSRISLHSQSKFAHEERRDARKQTENFGPSLEDNQQGGQCYSKLIPGQFIDTNSAEYKQNVCSNEFIMPVTNQDEAHTDVNSFKNPVTLAGHESHSNCMVSSAHQPVPVFRPCTQFGSNQDAYRSFLSSASSSLMLSTLLQNPSIHAVASLAASFWPSVNANAPLDLAAENLNGGMSEKQSNPSPSMAAVAAATVAAASAWWATNGLLPMFPPFHTSYSFAPPSTVPVPSVDIAQAPKDKKEKKEDRPQNLLQEDHQQIMDPGHSGALRNTQKASKLLPSSESELDECGRGERSPYAKLKSSAADKFEALPDTRFLDSDKTQHNKNSNCSTYGSNRLSSSEVEPESMIKKHKEVNDEGEQVHLDNHLCGEAGNHRLGNSRVTNGSRKEVLGEDGPAFQAHTTRELMPQRFSQLQTNDDEMPNLCKDKEVTGLLVDLNGKACESTNEFKIDSADTLVSEIEHGKLKASRRAFKPYRRCCAEAKDNQGTTDEEKSDQRIRMEGYRPSAENKWLQKKYDIKHKGKAKVTYKEDKGGGSENGGFIGNDIASTIINVSNVIALEYDATALLLSLITSFT